MTKGESGVPCPVSSMRICADAWFGLIGVRSDFRYDLAIFTCDASLRNGP